MRPSPTPSHRVCLSLCHRACFSVQVLQQPSAPISLPLAFSMFHLCVPVLIQLCLSFVVVNRFCALRADVMTIWTSWVLSRDHPGYQSEQRFEQRLLLLNAYLRRSGSTFPRHVRIAELTFRLAFFAARLAALKQKEAPVAADPKAQFQGAEPPSRRESLQPLESLERCAHPCLGNGVRSTDVRGLSRCGAS